MKKERELFYSLAAICLFTLKIKRSEQATGFVELNESIDEFIKTQCNKNTLNNTHRDISLLKKFLSAQNEEREIYNIEPEVLDRYISEFIVKVRKQDGEQYDHEATTLRSFVSSFDRFLRRQNYPELSTIIEGAEFKKTF